MPVANCIFSLDCPPATEDLVELWASESGVSSQNMSINIMTSKQQLGNQYTVMVNLLLPSIWSESEISMLQTGLARALAKCYGLALSQVHVITSIISSGRVVENGCEIKW